MTFALSLSTQKPPLFTMTFHITLIRNGLTEIPAVPSALGVPPCRSHGLKYVQFISVFPVLILAH